VISLLVLFPLWLGSDLQYEFDRLYFREPVAIVEQVVETVEPVVEPIEEKVFILPVDHGGLVSGWYFMDPRFPADGPQHTGIDLACIEGEAIKATSSGRVAFATWNGDCGKEVSINHGNGVITYYCHLSSFGKFGWVNQGDIIGYCGNTGLSTGVHLHYEKHIYGVHVNPLLQ